MSNEDNTDDFDSPRTHRVELRLWHVYAISVVVAWSVVFSLAWLGLRVMGWLN